jgi:hypothetical protein
MAGRSRIPVALADVQFPRECDLASAHSNQADLSYARKSLIDCEGDGSAQAPVEHACPNLDG